MDPGDRLRGSAIGLAAALRFGLGAPVSKLLLGRAPPLALAALLYLGAGVAFQLAPRRSKEASLTRADVPWVAGSVIAGAAVAPVLMLWGLTRLSGLAGSLLLNLEVPFTIALAVLVFREHLTVHEGLGATLVVAGAALLGARGEWGGALRGLGVGAIGRARPAHSHTHEPLEHDHLHVHDEHHPHAHAGEVAEPHAHLHRHEAVTHAHAHVSDAHHRHRHR